MNTQKDVKKLLRTLERDGYEIDTRSQHYKVCDGAGHVLVGIARTPSDPLAWKRIQADCRRAGLLQAR